MVILTREAVEIKLQENWTHPRTKNTNKYSKYIRVSDHNVT